MRLVKVSLLLFTFILAACSEDGNTDTPSEVGCSSATGLFTITAATCDGTAVSDLGSIAMTFNSSTSVTQSQGDSTCAATLDWDIVHGDFDNALAMTGNGNLRCSSGGSSVSSCTGTSANCDSTTDITGTINNFDSCALSGTEITLQRTVSSTNNPDSLSYCSDGEAEVITLTQSATATLADLDITNSDPADFGTVSVGGSAQATLTMQNAGAADASAIAVAGLAAPFTFFGGSYPGTGGTCATTLAAGASCTMVVSFDPTSAIASVDDLEISYNDSSTSQSFTHGVQGTGFSGSLANLTISDGPIYDFGTVPTGGTALHIFTVTNGGTATATAISEIGLASPFGFQGGSYPGTGGTCGASLAAGANCTIAVEVSPVVIGVAVDTIELMYNDGSGNQVADRDVQGTGVAPALLVISEADPYDFGNIQAGFSGFHSFTVTNVGGYIATAVIGGGLASPFQFQGGVYPGAGGTCATFVTPGANCTIVVEFAPLVPGVNNDTIAISYTDGVSAQVTNRDVQGTGTP